MEQIYFDNSATTRVCPEAIEAAIAAMSQEYGNPSSIYALGAAASRLLAASRETAASALGCAPAEVIFTGCGSESNNTALYGAATAAGRDRRKVLISAIEHPSITAPAQYLRERGYDLRLIPVDNSGRVDLEALRELLDEQVALVAVMHVNNETGAIQPLADIGAMIRAQAPQAFFHIDGVQSFGRLPIELKLWQADSCAASAHKIHGPKGVGLLWLNKSRHIQPLIRGGGQERGQRSGTENMPGIAAFAAAIRAARADMPGHEGQMRAVRQRLLAGLENKVEDFYLNSPEDGAAHILNISFLGCRSEVLLHYLESSGLYVSAGSACNSRSSKGSQVLTAMHLAPERVDSALRFSFCRYNTEAEAERAADIIAGAVKEVRQFSRAKR